jgi:hypothetical protein
MPTSRTITRVDFEYSGSLDTGLIIHKRTDVPITQETVQIIRREIQNRTPVLMGACRKPLVADSVGETLWTEHRVSPQVMSYVLPLLVEEGFCRVSDNKPFKIYLNSRR